MDLRWILIIALLSVRDTFCETFASVPSASIAPSEVDCQPYVEKAIKELVTPEPIGSTGRDQNIQNESPTSGSTPNDDVTGSSSQDGNSPDDSGQSTPPEPEKFEKEEETTRNEVNLNESVSAINEIENHDNGIIEAEEISTNETTENNQAHKVEEEDSEIEIVNEEEENLENNSLNVVENEVIEPKEEIVPIILDKDVVNNNVEIIIDIEDIKINNANKIVEPSVTKIQVQETIETTNANIKTETPKQLFKGTKKRNPKYWKFDPDDEPENTVPIVKPKPKRNLKYWKIDPDEFPLEQAPKPAEPPKLRNPKYWKLDPEEEKLYKLEEAKKTEQIKSVPQKGKRNPKYWKFDPDEETKEVNVEKSSTIDSTLKQDVNQIFKGTKKRNPKYWKFDPDEYEDEIKKEPVVKAKRNPKYWKFDPDNELDEPNKMAKEDKTEEKAHKKNKYWKTDEQTEDIIENKEEDKSKQNKYKKVDESNEDIKKIDQKEEEKPKKNKYWKAEEVENIIPKEVITPEEPIAKKNKYWKTEETEKPKEVKDEDITIKKNKYWKTEEKPVDPVKEKLIETQRTMYWKLDEEVKPSKWEKDTKNEKIKTTGDEVTIEEYIPEEDLTMDEVVPKNLRNKSHIKQTLKIGENTAQYDSFLSKVVDTTLKELKKVYEVAIKPLEMTFKYRDLSNRHFGEPEIFSKPLILFMGPWSGGKSSIVNYLLDIEHSQFALRTGAEPSPAYFNIMMYNNREAILDGTQLAADWTFSGLQKFGQGLLDKLRGLKLPHPLLEKVNIVEIPGILEMRKHVDRVFPFNDVCQWFIDRADMIFLVYDPAKLDVGPETEAILDQLKGREYQTRILLNKADKIRAEELMRIQGTLIWNISPLMSSAEPPVIYSVSLWSNPYEIGSPAKLLHSQELSFLKDIRSAIDRRVENKIASARRFAVRVRNHAKMVDCYLTTYYNHKSFFANRKTVSDDIIENPQNYHIYEGLSTLTNISRYDLPDPDVYRDFFRLNPVYEFKRLSDTCTYFRGCPINKLDMAIAYDLPDLIGQYKRQEEQLVVETP
ncbi:golgin subfamily A member 6-like protein 24 isoform X1 [Rhopalosiphum padi]|uniref:golgin subfamily A member 6-like protein 24 isoform X1 n=1 Tax=Rhopalosiphum padi TaxID=40932 RepID=UPI00298DC6BE|nr:golgin subfamily A member 6-like protein 24 isoform X1 [Rhopalosiphum padi]